MFRRSLLAGLATFPVASRAEFAPIRAVSSFSVIRDMVTAIGGTSVVAISLVGPDQDVHEYQPRPKDLRVVASADVLVRNGLGLEGWMDRLVGAAGFKGRLVTAASGVTPRQMRDDSGAIATDPHAWQDPRNGELYVRAIAAGLSEAKPDLAAAFAGAAESYAAQVRQTDQWIAATLGVVPEAKRRIITTHDAFGYYGARYGVEFLAAEGISTDTEPSAKSIAALVAQIKREQVRAIFIENMTSDRMARMLARETGAVLGGTVYSDALSPADGPAATYLAMLRHNTTLFARAMAG